VKRKLTWSKSPVGPGSTTLGTPPLVETKTVIVWVNPSKLVYKGWRGKVGKVALKKGKRNVGYRAGLQGREG